MKKQLLLLVMLLLPMVASAHDIEVQNGDGVTIYYNYINDGKELAVTFYGSSYSSNSNKYTGNVVIPEEATYMNRTRKVTSIGSYAFSDCSGLTTVTIPNSVTSIGEKAFYYCSSLTSVNIGNSVTNIGNYAFNFCSGLTSVTIPNSVTSIGGIAFAYCTCLTTVTIGNSVAIIGEEAFNCCYSLTTVTIGNSVASIGEAAFANCSGLKKVIVSDIAAWCGISFNGGSLSNPLSYAHHIYSDENTEIKDLVIPNSVTSISNYAFCSCSDLTSVTIPNSVTSIGESAFSGCSGLTSATIGNSVTSIGNYAFYSCFGLTSVTIPNSVTRIGNYAFYFCSGLTSVTIPNSVTSIGRSAFSSCSRLTSVTIGNSVTSVGWNAFDGCDIPTVISLIENPFTISGKTSSNRVFTLNTYSNATLYVPSGSIDKYKATDGWKDFVFIEVSGTPPTPPTPETCEKPTISYQDGKLTFTCATDGATCHYSITDDDIQAGSGNEVQLGVTYNISVYASKEGFENSETATATLCWIDATPQTEGTTTRVAQIAACPVLVKTDNGFITVEGVDAGTDIRVYTADGKLAGNAVSHNSAATVSTSIQSGSIAIVKVGDKSVKVIMR